MSPTLATGLATLLCLLPLLLAAFALVRPAATPSVIAILGTTALGALLLQAGPFTVGPGADARRWLRDWEDAQAFAGAGAAQCEAMLEAARTHRLILDDSDPARPVVAAALWSQLPEEARFAVEQCLRDALPATGEPGGFEVVER